MVGLGARTSQCLPSSTFLPAAASLCSRNVSYTAALNLRGSGGSLLALFTRPPKPVGDRDEPVQAGEVGWRLSLPTGVGDRGAVGCEPSQEQGLAPTRNSSWHQCPGSMAAAPQGVFSRGRVCAPTLCRHKGVRGPVLGMLWEGRALLVGL